MRFQQLSWSCGPAALVNAARALGMRVAEGRARTLAGTTHEGTDETELITAARALRLVAVPHHSADRAAAWAFVRSNVFDGRPCLICIDHWNHWVTVVGIVGDRVLVVDPANTKRNKIENGVHAMSQADLSRRWRCRSEQEPFYALAVGR